MKALASNQNISGGRRGKGPFFDDIERIDTSRFIEEYILISKHWDVTEAIRYTSLISSVEAEMKNKKKLEFYIIDINTSHLYDVDSITEESDNISPLTTRMYKASAVILKKLSPWDILKYNFDKTGVYSIHMLKKMLFYYRMEVGSPWYDYAVKGNDPRIVELTSYKRNKPLWEAFINNIINKIYTTGILELLEYEMIPTIKIENIFSDIITKMENSNKMFSKWHIMELEKIENILDKQGHIKETDRNKLKEIKEMIKLTKMFK